MQPSVYPIVIKRYLIITKSSQKITLSKNQKLMNMNIFFAHWHGLVKHERIMSYIIYSYVYAALYIHIITHTHYNNI